MAGEDCTHQIEDEPVHELYSSLVGSTTTNSSRQTHDVSRNAYTAATSTISASYRDNHNPPTRIIKDDKDESGSEFTSSSTFMKFYRGSCKSISEKQPPSSTPPPLANSKNVPSKKSESSGQAAANKIIMSTKSTRSERIQQAKRERDKQIQQERRIRAMLNSDLSEEDEALYNCFHR